MNRCVNCNKKIEKDAIWCEYCGTEQNPRYSLYGTFLVLILVAGIVMYGCSKYKDYKTKKEDIAKYGIHYENSNSNNNGYHEVWYRIEKDVITDYSYEVYGSVLHKENNTLRNVSIVFTCYSDDGRSLGEIYDEASEIKPNTIWKFKARYDGKANKCIFKEIRSR